MKLTTLILIVLVIGGGCILLYGSNYDISKDMKHLIEDNPLVDQAALNDEIRQTIYTTINDERRSVGSKPLETHWMPEKVASDHSDNMARYNFVSHTDQKGFDSAVRARGILFSNDMDADGNVVCEVISTVSVSYLESNGLTKFDTADIGNLVVQSQKTDNSGQWREIMSSKYVLMGVGVAYDGDQYLITGMFWSEHPKKRGLF